jgi:hypothetical protein
MSQLPTPRSNILALTRRYLSPRLNENLPNYRYPRAIQTAHETKVINDSRVQSVPDHLRTSVRWTNTPKAHRTKYGVVLRLDAKRLMLGGILFYDIE